MGCVCWPSVVYRNNFLLLTDTINYVSTLTGLKVVAKSFNTPCICWSTFTAFNFLLYSVANIQLGRWIQNMADPTRNKNIAELNFAPGLLHARTFIEISSSGHNHLPVSFTFPIPIATPYFMLNRRLLPNLQRSCNWKSFFLEGEVQMASDNLYSFVHECPDSMKPEQTRSILTKRNSHDLVGCNIANLQKNFLRTGDVSLFLPFNSLSKQLETIIDSASTMQEIHALNYFKPQANLTKIIESRATYTRLSAAPLHRLTHNNAYLGNPREIFEAFGRFIVSSLTTARSLPTLSPPFLNSFFLTKRDSSAEGNTKVSYNLEPDS